VYSREILRGLAAGGFADRWEWFYRAQRFWRALGEKRPSNVKVRFLADSCGNRGAPLFHGLNQRLPRKRFKRQVCTFHDLFVLSGDYSTADFRRRFAAQAREAAAASDLIVAVSAFTASQVEGLLHVPASRIRVVHHGVAPRPLPALPREKLVLCVGAIQRRKNQARLVRAFAALPDEWQLVLAGSEGFEASETLTEIARSPCRDRILVTGYVPDVELAMWYARAEIFAFPSLDEGFGMPLLEAMDAGVPVLTSRRTALREVAGDAALIVDPESEEDIADGLRALAADENLRARLTGAGRARARRFTWYKAVAETEAVYAELLP
jgi:glycosyltransferase involved in cell wall biosynthesis